jgi:RNA polymerase sigma factor (sigma-70 family)
MPRSNRGPGPDLAQTATLVGRARAGDRAAQDELFRHFAPQIESFLHARLPPHARGLRDTQDLAQSVCLRAFRTLDRFEYRGVGSFWSYVRRIAMNCLVDATRRNDGGPSIPEQSSQAPVDSERGPIEQAARAEEHDAYEKALGALPEKVREAVTMRLELGAEYALIASECGYPSPDAAKMAIRRAIVQLGDSMSPDDGR